MARTPYQRRVHSRSIPTTRTRPLFYDGLDPISMGKLQSMVTNATTLQRDALGRRSQADTRRNYDDEFGYPKNTWRGEDYRDLIEAEPIAMVANALYPIECWKSSPSVFELEDAETDTEFESAWDNLPNMLSIEPSYYAEEKGSSIWSMLLVADVLSGYSRHGVIFIGLDDGQQDLTQPAVPKKEQQCTFLRPFPGYLARITQYDTDTNSRRNGWPTQYAITLSDPTEAQQDQFNEPYTTQYVHWSRIIHIADQWHMPSASAVFAHPRLKELLNPILDVRKIRGSSAEMYYKGAFGGFHFGTHPSLGADVDVDADGLRDMYEQYINGMQRAMFSSGMQLDPLAPQVVDPTPQMLVQIQNIAMAMRCPVRKLIGNETGERSTTDDTKSWNGQLSNRHNRYLTPKLIVPLIDRLINLGVLPTPKQGYRCQWPDTNSLTDQEQATVFLTRMQAYQAYVVGGIEQIISPMDVMTKFDGMEEEEAQAIADAVEAQQEQGAQDNQALVDEHGLVPEVAGFKEPTPDPIEVAKAKAGITKNSEEEVEYILSNASKAKLTGGNWITIGGAHIYIKDGKAVGGPEHIVKKLNEMKVDFSNTHTAEKGKAKTHEKSVGKAPSTDTTKQADTVKSIESTHKEHLKNSIPEAQKKAVIDYTKDKYYSQINSQMRSCPPKFDCLKGILKTIAENTVKAIESAPKFTKPITVSRGMDLSGEVHSKFLQSIQAAAKAKKTFELPSITSTSSDGVKDAFKGNIEMKIVAKHGLSVKSVSKYSQENEILLHPNNKYKVTAVENKGSRHVVHLEQQ